MTPFLHPARRRPRHDRPRRGNRGRLLPAQRRRRSTPAASGSSGAVDAKTATSADFGGMDAWSRPPRRRASSTSSRCRRTGRTTARSSRPSRRSTASRSTQRSPTRPARTRSTPPSSSRARPARPTSSTSAPRWRWPTPRCSPRTRWPPGTTSRPTQKDADRPLGQRLRRLHVDRLRRGARCPRRPAFADLLKPEYKGKVALNGDPTKAGAAFSGVVVAAARPTAARSTTSPGIDFFGELKKAGNFLPVESTPATIEKGETPIVIDWDYLNVAPGAKLKGKVDWKVVVPGERGRRLATTSRPSTRTRRTRPPPGCGRSSSTATRARTCGSRAAPARCAPTP